LARWTAQACCVIAFLDRATINVGLWPTADIGYCMHMSAFGADRSTTENFSRAFAGGEGGRMAQGSQNKPGRLPNLGRRLPGSAAVAIWFGEGASGATRDAC